MCTSETAKLIKSFLNNYREVYLSSGCLEVFAEHNYCGGPSFSFFDNKGITVMSANMDNDIAYAEKFGENLKIHFNSLEDDREIGHELFIRC